MSIRAAPFWSRQLTLHEILRHDVAARRRRVPPCWLSLAIRRWRLIAHRVADPDRDDRSRGACSAGSSALAAGARAITPTPIIARRAIDVDVSSGRSSLRASLCSPASASALVRRPRRPGHRRGCAIALAFLLTLRGAGDRTLSASSPPCRRARACPEAVVRMKASRSKPIRPLLRAWHGPLTEDLVQAPGRFRPWQGARAARSPMTPPPWSAAFAPRAAA